MKKIYHWIKGLFGFERVLFADLDGTIIVTKSGKTFPENCDDWKFKDGILGALKKYNPTHLHIVSNQGGIEKGFFTDEEFREKIQSIIVELCEVLPQTKINYAYCSTNDKNNRFRKPNIGMLEYFYHDCIFGNDFNKNNALMIGDASGLKGQFSDSDYECAKRFGIKYIDVDYFIKWGNPCKYCGCNNSQDCKYVQDPNIVGLFPCNSDLSLEQWSIKFLNERRHGREEEKSV